MSQMKAAVWHDVHDVRVEDFEIPPIGGSEVKIAVAWAGICGSDLHAYHEDLSKSPLGVSLEKHALSGRAAPLVLGHEFSGTVVEVGPDVTHLAVGDRVAIEPVLKDFSSPVVQRGQYNLGDFRAGEVGLYGFNADGGFAEYVVVEEYAAHKIPDGLGLDEAALAEPLAVVHRAVVASTFRVGQTAAVVGAGPIGLLTVLMLKAAGAREIYLVDIVPERLALGEEIGALPINSSTEDAYEVIQTATNGRGVDVVFEAAGVQPTLDLALTLSKKGGELVILSIFSAPPTVNTGLVMVHEIRITSTIIYRDNFPEVLGLLASRAIDVRPLITSRIPLDDVVTTGLEVLSKDRSQAKVLVFPPSAHGGKN
ncbi:2,3-butanediol dehydrogenase (plasmid) [Arthrobacter sp. D3-18]